MGKLWCRYFFFMKQVTFKGDFIQTHSTYSTLDSCKPDVKTSREGGGGGGGGGYDRCSLRKKMYQTGGKGVVQRAWSLTHFLSPPTHPRLEPPLR